MNEKQIYNNSKEIQKFNVEKIDEKKIIKNNIKLCEKFKLNLNTFTFNEKLIKLLFNLPKQSYISNNNNNLSFINELLLNPNLCTNCLKIILDDYYFKQINNSDIDKKEKEILDIVQVFENMDEEKLNINIRLYHIYKKLINSFIEYIKDNNQNDKNENCSINNKNQKIIGIDCMLNIIDLLNKNISLIKEKNIIKKQFLNEVINEKNILIKEIQHNKNKFSLIKNIKENKDDMSKIIIGKNDNDIDKNKNEFSQINNKYSNNNLNIFKTKIIKTKKKGKKLKRISRKTKFIIKNK